jgi:hypothetical protein
MWLSKIRAASKHFLLTLLTIGIAACLVFFIWYPGIYSRVMPGTQLFTLVACVELILGPCMTLVIFNPQKSLKELLRDYSVVVGIQFIALGYGIFSVSQVRPAYTVLNGDQLQVVSASEIEAGHMAQSGEFARLPWLGPKLVCLGVPSTDAETTEAIEMSSNGIFQYEVPKYFKECDKNQLILSAKSMTEFRKIANDNKDNEMLKVLSKVTDVDQKYVWMPIKSRFSTSVALINITTEKPEYILDANKKLY